MNRARLSRRADRQLEDILTYVRDTNSAEVAARLRRRFVQVFRQLRENPMSGRARPEFAPGIRSVPLHRFVIFYRPDEDGVRVIAIYHGARDYESDFAE